MASTPIPYAIINGVRHDVSSIELKLHGQEFRGFKSITYSRKRERTIVRGNHPDGLGKTRGQNTYEGSCELYLAEFHFFMTDVLGGDGYGDVFFEINVTYTENGFDTIQDVLRGCTLDSTEAGGSEGTDALTRKFDLSPVKILFNGVDDCATPLQGVAA